MIRRSQKEYAALGELDSIVILLWENNRGAQALSGKRPRCPEHLALLPVSRAVCRAAGANVMPMCRVGNYATKGGWRGSNGSVMGHHKVTSNQ